MSAKNNNRLPLNLPMLQSCIKKDPSAYEEEFQIQYRHYESVLQILMFNPAYFDKEFESLVMFLAQTCPLYKSEVGKFPEQLINLLRNYSTGLHRASRLACCRALVALRSKSCIELQDIMPLFFELARCQDKQLRSYLKQSIITDIRNMNKKSRNDKVNRQLQKFVFAALENEQQETSAKMAIEIMKELYKKGVWRDKELVNQIARSCLSRSTKILVTSLQFFLGNDDEDSEDNESSDEEDRQNSINQLKETIIANRFNKSTRKRQKILNRVKKTVKSTQNKERKVETFNFSAIHLINDPQTFSEKLFTQLESTSERFEVKLMMMNLLSRLIGIHELLLLNYYPFITKYLHPHQSDVTKILQYAAQSTHQTVPPNELEPLLKAITNNFISEKNSTEAITVGLNSVREICARNPLVMDEDLLQDLIQYQKYKNKNVSIAAKSLVYLFRIKNPDLLKRKDRGKPTMATAELKSLKYGQTSAVSYVAGAEALNESSTPSRSSLKRTQSMVSLEDAEMDIDDEANEEQDYEDMDISDGEDFYSSDESGSDEVSDGSEQEYEDDEDDDEEDDENEYDERDMMEELSKIKPEDAKRKAELISTERILTTKEIKKIKAAQMAKQLMAAQPKRMTRKDETTAEVLQGTLGGRETVKLADIERIYKRPKHDKESRLSTVIEGRQGRQKFGAKKPKMNEFASTSNRDKRRNKAFGMLKHKLKRHKRKKTFHEKQLELKQKLLNR